MSGVNLLKGIISNSQSAINRDPNKDPAFKIRIVNYMDNEPNGVRDIEWQDNELEIHTRYGVEPSYADIRMYLTDPNFTVETASTMKIGDPIQILVHDLSILAETLLLIVKAIGYENGENGWCLKVSAEIPAYYYTSLARPELSIVMPKNSTIVDAIAAMIENTWLQYEFVDSMPSIRYDGNTIFKNGMEYSHVFSSNRPLNEVMESMVTENSLEWYFDIYNNAICIGEHAPLAHDDVTGITEVIEQFPGNVKFYSIGGERVDGGEVRVASAIVPGDPFLMCGNGLRMNDGMIWKVVKSIYYLKSDGESESQVWLLQSIDVCDNDVMDLIEDIKVSEMEKNISDHVKMMDIELSRSKDALGDNAGDPGDFYKFHDNDGYYIRAVNATQDPRKIEFYREFWTDRVVMSTPFAGDGVGIKFPKEDEGRHITISPFGLPHIPIAMNMIWRHKEGKYGDEDDVIPVCNPKDFYLRMHKGYLYFDEENSHWFIRSPNITLNADEVEEPTIKPRPDYPDLSTPIFVMSNDPVIINLHVQEDNEITIIDGKITIDVDGKNITLDSSGVVITDGTRTITMNGSTVDVT